MEVLSILSTNHEVNLILIHPKNDLTISLKKIKSTFQILDDLKVLNFIDHVLLIFCSQFNCLMPKINSFMKLNFIDNPLRSQVNLMNFVNHL